MADTSEVLLALFTTVGGAWAAYLTYLQAKLKQGQDSTNQILAELRMLSEGRNLSQLKFAAESLARIVEYSKEPTDVAAAEIARKAFLDRAARVLKGYAVEVEEDPPAPDSR